MITLILDLLVVAVIGVSVFFAYKKGFIKTLFSLLGGLIAVVLAISLCTPVANWLNQAFVGPAVRNTVLTAVNGSSLAQSYDDAINSVDVVGKLQEMPEKLRSFLEKLDVDVEKIVQSAEDVKANSVEVKEKLIDSIAAPVSEMISKAVAMIGLVVVLFVLLFVASRLLDAIFRLLPFAGSFNKIGGVLFGALRGVLIVFLLSAILYWLARGNVLVNVEQLDKTLLLRLVNNYNPILNVLK